MADLTGMLQAAAGAAGEATDPFFNQTTLLLHGDGTNGAQNNTFLDSSTNNFTITRNGNTTQGTFSPFSGPNGYWSNFFDGTNDRLTIADNAALRPGTSAFTIEAWVYRAAAGAAHTIFAKGASTPTGFAFLITSSNTLRFTDTSTDITSTGTVAANTWVHVAAVREGTGSNQLKLYINGVQDGTGTSSTNFTQTEEARIGENRGATDDFNGYISNFRYVIGTALYTSGFTPSKSPLTTTSQGATSSQVELLTCQSNRFLDNSTNGFTISPVNNTSVQPFSPFLPTAEYDASVNGGSGYFDGSGDYLTVANNAALQMESGDFTVEFWWYPTTISGFQTPLEKGYTGSGGLLLQTGNGNGTIVVYASGSTVITSSTAVTINAWNHMALSRSGTSLVLYLNGVSVGTATNSTNFNSSATLGIGATATAPSGGSVGDFPISGYLSNVRLVKGTAVYTAAFTPPTAPLTAITNTSLLCNFTNAGIFDNTGKNDLETVGDAQIDTTTKKYGTGSIEFDGTGDYLQLKDSPEFVFGTGPFTIEGWIYLTSTGTSRHFYDQRPPSTDGAYPTLRINNSNEIEYVANSAVRITSSTLLQSTWYYFAVARSGTSTKLFVDGTQAGFTYTDSTDYLCGSNRPFVGGSGFHVASLSFEGFIDDLRITKGIARYTANFTPPTEAFLNL
jgi:hypothetical protein